MKKNLLLLTGCLFMAMLSIAQGLKISPGTTFKARAGVSIVVKNGNVINNGDGDFSTADLYMTGGQSNNIDGISSIAFSNLYINKNSATVFLNRDVNVTNNVVFQNGLLDLNGNNLLLSPAGLLINENENNHIIGPLGGYVSITVNLNDPSGNNPGNLGAAFTSSHDMGSVVIKRGHQSQTNTGGKSILRYFNIQPSNNSGLNTIFRLYYLDAELNGIDENDLKMWKSTNGGTSWSKLNTAGKSSTLDFIDVDNLNSFGRFTLSNSTFSAKGVNANDEYVNNILNNNLSDKIFSVALTPNPVAQQGKVIISVIKPASGMMNVFGSDGRKIMQQQLNLHTGANEVTINAATLASGAYYLVVETKDGVKKTISFTKQ